MQNCPLKTVIRVQDVISAMEDVGGEGSSVSWGRVMEDQLWSYSVDGGVRG